ncbi:MAG: ATP synthase F1 subunit epsilon [Deltaproteobacteria bacterium]|nr:ATP synthase F1 subunit epsilon [Deltaproteobacteria bacterium]
MSKKFKVEVVTPLGVVLDKEVEEIIAPGVMGEFGVLIGHTPMLTFIKPGIFSYLDENNEFVKFVVGDGFCEVLKDSVTVLVEEAQRTEEIDPNEATAQLLDLEAKLNAIHASEDPEEYARITARMKMARQKVAAAKKS